MREFENIVKDIDFGLIKPTFDIEKAKAEFNLTDEEAASLLLHAVGVRVKKIAEELEIGPKTVEDYINKWRKDIEKSTKVRPVSSIDEFHLLRAKEIIQLPIDRFK